MPDSEPFGLGMLTRNEGERLAQAIHALRPAWPIPSLITFLQRRSQRPMLDIALELVYVALDPDTQSPARIDVDGPWKRLRHADKPTQAVRTITADDCDICTQPEHTHPIAPTDDHEYVRRGSLGPGQKPTPEHRAAIDAARQTAHTAATDAAREDEDA